MPLPPHGIRIVTGGRTHWQTATVTRLHYDTAQRIALKAEGFVVRVYSDPQAALAATYTLGYRIGLILGVNHFLDMCRTTVNVTGDLGIAAMVSRNAPTISSRMFTTIRKVHQLSVSANIASENTCAAWLTVSSHAKIDAAVTMNRTEAVVSMVSKDALARVRKVIVR